MNNISQFKIENDSHENDGLMDQIYDICFGPGRFAKAAHLLRENNNCLYEISKIIIDVASNKIIGGCRMWPIAFSGGGIGLFLGPIAILPEYRNLGLGGQLVEQCLEANHAKDNLPVFLVGDIGFFEKFGFKNLPIKNLKLPSPVIYKRILYIGDNIDFINCFYGNISGHSPMQENKITK